MADLFSHELAADGSVTRAPLLDALRGGALSRDALCLHAHAAADPALRVRLVAGELTPTEDRAVGAMLGMAVGDALGAPVEFMPVRPSGLPPSLEGVGQLLPGAHARNAFALEGGQWTDDTAMGLCLADSLLAGGGAVRPADLMLRFLAWWHAGYNNAFGHDTQRRDRSSVGLGGQIGGALDAFLHDGVPLTRMGDSTASGNGSIMRNGPIASCFWRDEHAAAAAARLQSRTTHAGDEAAECAALLATVMARGIAAAGARTPKQVLESLVADGFDTPCASVACLAGAQAEPGGDPNRDWRWQRAEHQYSPARSAAQPGYVGSYAMDAAAMALHCVWVTDSAKDALLLAANHRGDADSVAAVTGALCGALYGAAALPRDWVAAVQRWDGGGSIAERALLLHACHAAADKAEAAPPRA